MAQSDTNIAVLSGRLVADPQSRGGGKVCAFSLASNRFYRNADNETVDEVLFIDVTVFGFEAEAVLKNLRKGVRCLVEGRLELNKYQDSETGQTRSQVRMIAQRVTSPAMRSTPPAGTPTEGEPEVEAAEPVEQTELAVAG